MSGVQRLSPSVLAQMRKCVNELHRKCIDFYRNSSFLHMDRVVYYVRIYEHPLLQNHSTDAVVLSRLMRKLEHSHFAVAIEGSDTPDTLARLVLSEKRRKHRRQTVESQQHKPRKRTVKETSPEDILLKLRDSMAQ